MVICTNVIFHFGKSGAHFSAVNLHVFSRFPWFRKKLNTTKKFQYTIAVRSSRPTQLFFFLLYSVVNKPNKNVRIQLQNELTDDNDDDDTEAETEHTDEDRCLTPSNTYLEISFENQNQAQPKKQQQSPQKILPSQVYNSTPNGKVRTITQV